MTSEGRIRLVVFWN